MAVSIAAGSHPAAANDTTEVFGGAGGKPFYQPCDPGSSIGVQATSGAWANDIAPLCAAYDPSTMTMGTTKLMKQHGGSNGGRIQPEQRCESNNAAIYSMLVQTTLNDNNFAGFVDNLEIGCAIANRPSTPAEVFGRSHRRGHRGDRHREMRPRLGMQCQRQPPLPAKRLTCPQGEYAYDFTAAMGISWMHSACCARPSRSPKPHRYRRLRQCAPDPLARANRLAFAFQTGYPAGSADCNSGELLVGISAGTSGGKVSQWRQSARRDQCLSAQCTSPGAPLGSGGGPSVTCSSGAVYGARVAVATDDKRVVAFTLFCGTKLDLA